MWRARGRVVDDEALCARRWLPGNSAVCYRLCWGMLDEEDLECPRSPAALNSRFIGALALANERHHEYATLEHLLLALIEDQDAAAVMCGRATSICKSCAAG